MKKVLVFMLVSAVVIFVVFTGNKLFFSHLEKKTNDQIQKVMEYQGISIENIEHEYVNYHKMSSTWGKDIYIKDDPGIEYQYQSRVGQSRVIVFAKENGVPLENIKKKAKYVLPEVIFDKNNEIVRVTDMRTDKVLYER